MEQTKINAIIAKQNKTGYNKSSLKSILFCGLMSLGMVGISTNNLMGENSQIQKNKKASHLNFLTQMHINSKKLLPIGGAKITYEYDAFQPYEKLLKNHTIRNLLKKISTQTKSTQQVLMESILENLKKFLDTKLEINNKKISIYDALIGVDILNTTDTKMLMRALLDLPQTDTSFNVTIDNINFKSQIFTNSIIISANEGEKEEILMRFRCYTAQNEEQNYTLDIRRHNLINKNTDEEVPVICVRFFNSAQKSKWGFFIQKSNDGYTLIKLKASLIG